MNYLLWVILPNINAALSCLGAVGLLAFGGIGIRCYWLSSKELEKNIKTGLIISSLFILVSCLTPDKEQLQVLVLIDTVNNIKSMKELPENTIGLLNSWLKNQTKKLR